jgi:hypothetical protein
MRKGLKSSFLFFFCKQDSDVENFIRHEAIEYEKIGRSRTFIIYDEDGDEFKILAYFTLAIKVLGVNKDLLSIKKTKELDGKSSKNYGRKITEFPTILIGQIAKNDKYAEFIDGLEIMQYCISMVLLGQSILGGRIVMLECKNIQKIIDLYQKFGFEILSQDETSGLLQMIRVIRETDHLHIFI